MIRLGSKSVVILANYWFWKLIYESIPLLDMLTPLFNFPSNPVSPLKISNTKLRPIFLLCNLFMVNPMGVSIIPGYMESKS